MCAFILIGVAGCADENGERKALSRQRPTTKPTGEGGEDSIKRETAVPQKHTIGELWILRRDGKHKEVIRYVDELMGIEELDYDTKGTCLFLQGDSYRQIGEFAKARDRLGQATREYARARYKDPRYGYIEVRQECEVATSLVAERDTCPFPESSRAYVTLAWARLNRKRFEVAMAIAEACIVRFQGIAAKQQLDHAREYGDGWPDLSPDPDKNKDVLEKYWALYDVATCFFILGQAYEKQANVARENQKLLYEKAIGCYDEIIRKYPGAQCFDPRGPWYFRAKEAAERQINLISSDKLGTPHAFILDSISIRYARVGTSACALTQGKKQMSRNQSVAWGHEAAIRAST